MRIVILVPYFGKCPKWIEFFIKSCAYNPQFNWLIYGDLTLPMALPENVKFVKADIKDFEKRIKRNLSITIKLENPYKICDFRPAFGVLFSDFFQGVNYWGYCDIDLVFGKMDDFLSHSQISRHDIITSRKDYLAGHFTLFRNCERINSLFRQINSVNKYLSEPKLHFAIDEKCNFTGRLMNETHSSKRKKLWDRSRRSILFRVSKMLSLNSDITSVVANQENIKNISVLRVNNIKSDNYFEKAGNAELWKISWNQGRLFDVLTNMPLFYFHFLNSKQNAGFNSAELGEVNSFIITHEGFIVP